MKEHYDFNSKYAVEDIKKTIENISFVVFPGRVFQQIVGIQTGTNCTPPLAEIFVYS